METARPDFAGYTRDQYYRRIRTLVKASLITPQRGKHNEILLGAHDRTVLQELGRIEREHPKLSVDGCLGLLQAEVLKREKEMVQGQRDYLLAENRILTRALVRYRRWSLRRVLARVRSFFRRGSQAPG